jgi:uncharacterized protein with HEPN domain
MRPEDRTRVLHMIEATEAALGFVSGRKRADLEVDRMLLFALVRAIEIQASCPRRHVAHSREFPGI